MLTTDTCVDHPFCICGVLMGVVMVVIARGIGHEVWNSVSWTRDAYMRYPNRGKLNGKKHGVMQDTGAEYTGGCAVVV